MNKTVFSTVMALVLSAVGTTAGEIRIVPRPQRMEVARQGEFRIDRSLTLRIADPSLTTAAGIFAGQLESLLAFTPAVESGKARKGAVNLSIDPALEGEEYFVRVAAGRIDVAGGSPRGAMHGMQTLRQVIACCAEDGAVRIPALEIADKPFFPYRGMMLDVCRHFRTADEVKRFIDLLCMHKLNTFHWHLTDDQGWRIDIAKYPLLREKATERAQTVVGHALTSREYDGKPYGRGMSYSPEEIVDVVRYAADRGIEVIPEIEMPGHALAALAAYPELGCRGADYAVSQTWGVFDDVFCAGNDRVFEFMEAVLDEVIALFPSKFIHIGGDECPKTRWKECPRCQARMRAEGLSDEQELQSYFMKRIERMVNSRGRSIIGWEEILEGGVSPTATVMSWKSPQAGIEAAKKGNKVIMVPSKFSYFDYYQSEDTAAEPFAIGGYVPVSKVYAYDPYDGLDARARKAVLGVQANLWTEYIETMPHVEYMVLPRMAALAENGWAYEGKDYDDFLRRMHGMRLVYDRAGYNYARHIFPDSASAPQRVRGFRCIVSGYSNAARIATSNPADLSYLKRLSRIYCFGISPDSEGCWWVDPVRERNQATVRAAIDPCQEAFLVVGGGATAGNMYRMGTDPAKRAAFAEAVVDYAHEKGFDGIDVDWETDWSVTPFLHVPEKDMVALLAAIRARMKTLPGDTKLRLLTAALSSNTSGQRMGGRIARYVDQINVMIYDTYGTREEGYPHAPMRVLKASLAGYGDNGVPSEKIIVGIPFYGGDKSATPVATQPYDVLCDRAGEAITPATNAFDGYAFNGADLVGEKTRYVLDNGYAGITIWELSHDVAYDSPLSLLRAICREACEHKSGRR